MLADRLLRKVFSASLLLKMPRKITRLSFKTSWTIKILNSIWIVFLGFFLHVHQTLMQSRAHLCPDKEAHLKKIRALFSKLGGTEEAGAITYDMLEEHIQTTAVREYFDSLGLDVSDAWSFFKLLDSDGGTKG